MHFQAFPGVFEAFSRRFPPSKDFLERAFQLCHTDMPLFGDQDAMIHLLLNPNALSLAKGDPLDPHAVPRLDV